MDELGASGSLALAGRVALFCLAQTNPNQQKPMKTNKLPTVEALASLFVSLKPTIDDDFRASDDPDDKTPAMTVTIGWNDETGRWGWQLGDNSFTGGAYGFPHWGVVRLERRSNSRDLARVVRDQLSDCVAWR